jgi:hypothetical protein
MDKKFQCTITFADKTDLDNFLWIVRILKENGGYFSALANGIMSQILARIEIKEK